MSHPITCPICGDIFSGDGKAYDDHMPCTKEETLHQVKRTVTATASVSVTRDGDEFIMKMGAITERRLAALSVFSAAQAASDMVDLQNPDVMYVSVRELRRRGHTYTFEVTYERIIIELRSCSCDE